MATTLCTANQILKKNAGDTAWECATDATGTSTLQQAYTAGNSILTTTGSNIVFTLGEVAAPTSFTVENQDTAGVSAQRIFNSIAGATTLTNGLLIENTGTGTMTNGIQILESAGTITDGILISSTLGNILNTPTLDITGAGNITGVAASITGASGLTVTPAAAAALTLGTTGGGNTTAITLATDSTGDAEVVLPDQSISGLEILNATVLTGDIGTDTILAGNIATGAVGALELATDAVAAATDLATTLCTASQILKKNVGDTAWECATDATSAGGGIATIQENDVDVVTSATTIDFLGTDFVVGAVGAEGNISIDYPNSEITRNDQNETIIGDWAFTFAAAEALDIASDLATAGTLNVASITGTPSATNGTIRGLAVINASSANANGIDTGLLIDNSDDSVAIGTGINFTSTGGGAITTGIDLTATAIGTGISMGANDIVGTTGIINYTGFDVDASGNLDALGTITAGSGNVQVTDAAGKVQHDSIVDCTNGQILKWATAGGWGCAADAGGGDTTKYLSANQTISSTTMAKVTGLDTTIAAGTWAFRYIAIYQSTATATAVKFGVNFSGTQTKFVTEATGGENTTSASTGAVDQVHAAFGLRSGGASRAPSATTVIFGPTSVDTANANMMAIINGIIVVTVSGDLQLYFGSEATGSTQTIMANSSLILSPITAGADLAELYSTRDTSIGAGDVVSLDSSLNAGVKKSDKAYDANAFGIISTSPSLVMGTLDDPEADPVMVALSGRVPVKVSTENGPIEFGDLLTASSTPGVAMRATKAGQVIGQAMSEFGGKGIGNVTVFIKTDYSNGAKLADLLPGLNQDGTKPSTGDMDKKVLTQFIAQKEQLAKSVNLSEITTDRVIAGLEIITPRVLAGEVETDTLAAATGTDVTIQLDPEGKLILQSVSPVSPNGIVKESKTSVITFDADGNASFTGEVTTDGLIVNGHISANEDITGTAVIPIGKTSVYVRFSQPYGVSPKITTSASDFTAVRVDNKSINGFRVSIPKARSSNITIDWVAIEPKQ